jgi:hypothetical protein
VIGYIRHCDAEADGDPFCRHVDRTVASRWIRVREPPSDRPNGICGGSTQMLLSSVFRTDRRCLPDTYPDTYEGQCSSVPVVSVRSVQPKRCIALRQLHRGARPCQPATSAASCRQWRGSPRAGIQRKGVVRARQPQRHEFSWFAGRFPSYRPVLPRPRSRTRVSSLCVWLQEYPHLPRATWASSRKCFVVRSGMFFCHARSGRASNR